LAFLLSWSSSDPEDFENTGNALKVLVAGDQDSFPRLGEGGGETVGVGKMKLSFEAGVLRGLMLA